jgi:hypothetical protein
MIQCFIWNFMRICHLVIFIDYFHFGMLCVCMFMCGILPLTIDFSEYCGQYYQDRPLLLLSFQRQVSLTMLSVNSITKFISCMWRENAMLCYVLVMIVCTQCVVDIRIGMQPFSGSIAKILLKQKVINGNKWYEWKQLQELHPVSGPASSRASTSTKEYPHLVFLRFEQTSWSCVISIHERKIYVRV